MSKLHIHPTYPGVPNPLEEIYLGLENEVFTLYERWIMFSQLFKDDKEQTALLEKIAPSFFGSLSIILLSDLVSSLCRLTDPPSMHNRQNLVLSQLIEHLNPDDHEAKIKELEQALKQVEKFCKPLKTIRNRRLAHSDLKTILSPTTNALPAISVSDIKNTLDSVAQYMNTFKLHFTGYTCDFEDPSLLDDATGLIEALRNSVSSPSQQKMSGTGASPTKIYQP